MIPKNNLILGGCPFNTKDDSDVNDVINYIFSGDRIYYASDYIKGVFYRNFNKIPEHIINELKDKTSFLVVGQADETGEGYIDVILENICHKHKIPLEQLIVLAGSVDYAEIFKEKIKNTGMSMPRILFYNTWEKAMKRRFIADFLINVNPNVTLKELECLIEGKNLNVANPLEKSVFKKSYLNLNYRWKPHRIAFILALNDRGLLNSGYTSFSGTPSDGTLWFAKSAGFLNVLDKTDDKDFKSQWDVDIEFIKNHFNDPIKNIVNNNKDFIEQLPIYLDRFTDTGNGPDFSTTRGILNYFRNSFFSIVTEAFYSKREEGFVEKFNKECRFITEKTFRCIVYKHPFILLTLPHSLRVLHDMGYKTFDGIFDESYDDEEDDTKRMIMVLNEVERLCNLDTETLEEYRLKLIDILEHNHKVFMERKTYIYELK